MALRRCIGMSTDAGFARRLRGRPLHRHRLAFAAVVAIHCIVVIHIVAVAGFVVARCRIVKRRLATGHAFAVASPAPTPAAAAAALTFAIGRRGLAPGGRFACVTSGIDVVVIVLAFAADRLDDFLVAPLEV